MFEKFCTCLEKAYWEIGTCSTCSIGFDTISFATGLTTGLFTGCNILHVL